MPRYKNLKNLLAERKNRNKESSIASWMRDQFTRMTQLNQGIISMSSGK